MKSFTLFFALLFTVLISKKSNGQNDVESLLKHLNNYIEKNHIPGAMISIVKSDTILFSGGIGYANTNKKEKVTAEHLFRQGSISKSFTALGLVDLVLKGKLNLNTPIRKIDADIPFSNQWESNFPVQVVHLLEHTSGFDEFHLPAVYNTKDNVEPATSKMVYAHRKSLTSRWKPGTLKAYSNVGYIVAGHILETVSNEPYHQYLKRNILEPLNMINSGFYFKEPTNTKIAQGYRYNGNDFDEVVFTNIQGGPAGSFCSNAKEMSHYLQFMLKRKATKMDSLLYTNQTFNRIEQSKTNIAAKSGLPFGYGLGNYSIWKNGFLFHGHGGGIEGFSSRYLYSRDANLGIAVAINREGNANALADEVLKYLLGNQTTTPKNRTTLPIPESIKNTYAGFYKFSSPRHKMFAFTDTMMAGLILDFEDDKIITRSFLGKARDTLYYAGNNQFYKNNEAVPSTMFLESESGNQAFWINENYTEKESRWKRLLINFTIFFSVVFPLIFILHTIIRFVMSLFFKNRKPIKNVKTLFIACLSYLLMFIAFAMVMNNRENSGNLNFNSILFYLSSFSLVIFSIYSVYNYFKLSQKRSFKIYYLLITLSVVILSFSLWRIGFIGLKLWDY